MQAAQRVAVVKAVAVEIDVKWVGDRKRTDADIARAVENVLEWSSMIHQGAVKVAVESGWVTLTGQVDWQFQRQSASDSLQSLMGVTGVSDQIVLKPMVTTSAVKSDIEAALKRHAVDDAKLITAEVHGSTVTLRGKVHSWSERGVRGHLGMGNAGCPPSSQ